TLTGVVGLIGVADTGGDSTGGTGLWVTTGGDGCAGGSGGNAGGRERVDEVGGAGGTLELSCGGAAVVGVVAAEGDWGGRSPTDGPEGASIGCPPADVDETALGSGTSRVTTSTGSTVACRS